MDYYSPLRYPGGKGKISSFFKRVFRDNYLYDGVYVEPYAGGASIGLSLLLNQYASKVVINDVDLSIYAFWHSVVSCTDELCRLILDTPVTIETWKRQKEFQRDRMNTSHLQLGFSTFFLNRTNRSGIVNAGVIGGTKQDGKWRIDARFNKRELIKRIERIASYRDKIVVLNQDACKLIRQLKEQVPTKCLFYFDPPYFVKGKDLYLNSYNQNDHATVASEIKTLSNHKWIVTYDNVPFIRNLYSGYRHVKYHLNYTARGFSTGEEIMVLSNGLYVSSLKPKTITAHHIT